MKNVLFGVAMLALGSQTFARGGESGGGSLLTRGSQAWFVSESIEHTLRVLVVQEGVAQSDIVSAESATTAGTAEVVIGIAGGTTRSFTCQLVDEFSRGGTVLKKDVVCRKN